MGGCNGVLFGGWGGFRNLGEGGEKLGLQQKNSIWRGIYVLFKTNISFVIVFL